MSKEVDLRIKELTHVIHRQLLTRSLEQVKTLTPLLISSINVCITSKHTGNKYLILLSFSSYIKHDFRWSYNC
jgi:vinculin